MMKKMCPVHMVAYVLVLIGALNWGLVGFFNFNLVNAILGGMPMIERVIYAVVGLAAVAMLFVCKCRKCNMCCGGDKDGCSTGDKSCCDGEHKM